MPENLTLPLLIYHTFRRDQLCVPQGCDRHIEVRDEHGYLVRRDRCDTCPLDSLDRQVAQHPALGRAFDLEFALGSHVNIGLDQIYVDEFRALKCLKIERDKYQAEQIKNRPKG